MTERVSAAALLGWLLDDALVPWDTDVVSGDPLRVPGYPERLAQAAAEAGTSESVVTGVGRVAGREVTVVAGEFAFLAGTMGVAAGERVARAFERAAERGLPVIGLPVSGGTRMQEGVLAFVQMAKVAAAVQRYRATGLPYVAYLRHPTTGGVLASWASLAHVTFAEPGALIGMTGPRVIAQLTGRELPEGTQRAERLLARGLVDDLVAPEALRERVTRVLAVTGERTRLSPATAGADPGQPLDAWRAVQRTRDRQRPGLREVLDAAEDVTVLRGDGTGADDRACVAALARVRGHGVVLVGHDRPPGDRGARLDAVGYRKARRAMDLAAELGLPLVTVIDTPGAELTQAAEEGGLAAEVARSLATMAALPVLTVAVLLGEGSGGGALAWLPADRVLCAADAWLAPIAPEGASVILHRTTERAPELAVSQGITADALAGAGIVDRVLALAPSGSAVADAVAVELSRLAAVPADERLAARDARLRTLGSR